MLIHLIKNTRSVVLPLTIILYCLIPFNIYQIFYNLPQDYLQKDLVKIMYIHVPSAWLALGIYIVLSTLSIIFLITRNPVYDIFAKSLSGIGIIMTINTLITGAIWAKPTWGSWWVWDARLTSMLVLMFIYIIYILLRDNFRSHERAAKVSAIFAIVGLINIPIVKFSVYLWSTLHQKSSILKFDGPSIHPTLLYPLVTSFIMFGIFCAIIFLNEIDIEMHNRKLRKYK